MYTGLLDTAYLSAVGFLMVLQYIRIMTKIMAKTNYTYLNNYHMTTIFMECDERTYCRAHGTQREQIVAFNMAKTFKKEQYQLIGRAWDWCVDTKDYTQGLIGDRKHEGNETQSKNWNKVWERGTTKRHILTPVSWPLKLTLWQRQEEAKEWDDGSLTGRPEYQLSQYKNQKAIL